MIAFFDRYATPLTAGLFFVSLISGVFLFVHIGPSGFRGMHEILSMVLILPFVLHIWKNWRPFKIYFRKAPMAISLVLCLIAAGVFLVPTSGGNAGGPPQFALAEKVLANSPSKVAPLLNMTSDELVGLLTKNGFTVENADQPLNDIATKSGKDSFALFLLLNQGNAGSAS